MHERFHKCLRILNGEYRADASRKSRLLPYRAQNAILYSVARIDSVTPMNTQPHITDILRTAGLRPTQQRSAIVELLLKNGHRHVTAEALHGEATQAKVPVSLATIYNTLNQLVDAGLLRVLLMDGEKRYYDTDISMHSHFYFEDEELMQDAPPEMIQASITPQAPEGYAVRHVDVVVRLKRMD